MYKQRLWSACMTHGTINLSTSILSSHRRICFQGHLLKGYRVVKFDYTSSQIEMLLTQLKENVAQLLRESLPGLCRSDRHALTIN